jgi:hypothetical protein
MHENSTMHIAHSILLRLLLVQRGRQTNPGREFEDSRFFFTNLKWRSDYFLKNLKVAIKSFKKIRTKNLDLDIYGIY